MIRLRRGKFSALGLVKHAAVGSAAYLFPTGENYAQLLPITPLDCIFAAIDPFRLERGWSPSSICVSTLAVNGVSATKIVFEVASAGCKTFPSKVCPASCDGMVGKVITVVDPWLFL